MRRHKYFFLHLTTAPGLRQMDNISDVAAVPTIPVMKSEIRMHLRQAAVIAALLVLLSGKSAAQSHELYANWGTLTGAQLGFSIGTIFGSAIGVGFANAIIERLGGTGVTYVQSLHFTGAIGLGYNRLISPRWSIGLQGVFDGMESRLQFSNGTRSSSRLHVYALMLRSDYRWVNRPAFRLYSGAAFGGSYFNSFEPGYPANVDPEFNGAFQITALGLRIGKGIGVFAEAGVGFAGTFCGGLSGRF